MCIWNFEESNLTVRSGTELVRVELFAVKSRECVRRLYATSTVEIPPFSQADIGAKTVWSTLPPKASWMIEPVEIRPGVLLARTLLSDDPT